MNELKCGLRCFYVARGQDLFVSWVPFLGPISKKDSSCFLLDNVLCHYSSQRSHRPILVIPLYWTKIENSHGILLSTFVRRNHWPRSKVSLLFKYTRGWEGSLRNFLQAGFEVINSVCRNKKMLSDTAKILLRILKTWHF